MAITVRGLLMKLSSFLKVHPATKLPVDTIIADACRWAGRSEDGIPYSYYSAAYGVAWAIQSGRVGGAVEAKIKGMSAYRFCALLDELAGKVEVAATVPRLLNEKFA